MKPIDLSLVRSVYSGRNGECCCGCSGTHSYASHLREDASKKRGYVVDDDEVSNGAVKRIVNKINRKILENPEEVADHRDGPNGFVSMVIKNRLYVAYTT